MSGQFNNTTRAYVFDATPDDYGTITSTAQNTEALTEGEYCLGNSIDCFIRVGATASAGDGSMLVGAFAGFHFIVTEAQAKAGATLSIIRLGSADGVFTLNKVS